MNARLREFLRHNRSSLCIARAPTKSEAFMVYLRARSLRHRISNDEWTRCVRAMFLYL